MRRRIEAAFAALLVAMFAWSAWQATFWPERAALFPLAIALPATVLALVQLGSSALARPAPPAADEVPSELPQRERLRRSLEAAGWIVGSAAAVWALGFLAAIPLASLLYLRRAGEGWAASVVIPGATWAFMYGLFDRMLHVPLPAGELVRLVGVG